MIALSLLMALRFLGLFLVLPLLALYAKTLYGGANEFLVGVALGAYALSQTLLQIPFGKLSDSYGRKHVLAAGLILLGLGSVVCAISDNIYLLIFGRFLQGAGAIGGVVLAYMSDLSDEENRAKHFARMGQFIALSFAVSMVAGPLIGSRYGVSVLFDITTLLAFISLFILYKKVPAEPKVKHFQSGTKLREIVENRDIVKVYFSGFMQKALMTTTFLLTPLIFVEELHWEKAELYKVYLPALLFGIAALPIGAILGQKKGKGKLVFLLSAFFMLLTATAFLLKYFYLAVILFFIGFNLLEPVLQSYITKLAKSHQKATAVSLGNSFQYLGIFLGGAVSGYFLEHFSLEALMLFLFFTAILWIGVLFQMKNITQLKSKEYLEYSKEFIDTLRKDKEVYDFYIKENRLTVRYLETKASS